jgi:hypothetical protein
LSQLRERLLARFNHNPAEHLRRRAMARDAKRDAMKHINEPSRAIKR